MLSIIGCGNPNRKDDGVGIVIINSLQEYLSKKNYTNINLFDAGTSGMDVMFKAKGSKSLIIIDANLSNSKPGSLFIVPGEELSNIPEPSYNLHDFRWDNAIYAGKKIYANKFPKDISVYLIEAESVELGIGLSHEVNKTASSVIAKIKKKMDLYGN
ncbi:MAG: hydrogenase maturation protease [Enterobacterales bacterium]|nr:hydrogenase maturation protease [Enterobacterales bacterium]